MPINDPAASANLVQRAKELLSHGAAAADELGHRAGTDAADALKLLEEISGSTSELLDVNLRLVPLMSAFQRRGGKHKWLRWFTGEELEQDVFFDDVRDQIQALVDKGQQGKTAMERQVKVLSDQYRLMETEIALLESDIEAARLLASPAYAAQRQATGISEEDLARLLRRIGNLEAMATATQLTRAQFQVAIQHAKSVLDRYREIRTLLLPIWKQAVGFDLFSRRVSPHID